MNPDEIAERFAGTFPGELGIEILESGPGRARGRLAVESRHLHPGGYVHAGVWVSLADTVAAWATFPNLEDGQGFSTAEIKTNLFGLAREGDLMEAEALPLHIGRRTQMWEVRVGVGGKIGALYVCTQVVV